MSSSLFASKKLGWKIRAERALLSLFPFFCFCGFCNLEWTLIITRNRIPEQSFLSLIEGHGSALPLLTSSPFPLSCMNMKLVARAEPYLLYVWTSGRPPSFAQRWTRDRCLIFDEALPHTGEFACKGAGRVRIGSMFHLQIMQLWAISRQMRREAYWELTVASYGRILCFIRSRLC